MTKTIKLYHGTNTVYNKVDLRKLVGFSEGAGIYMTSSPSYAITYTPLITETSFYSIGLKMNKKSTTNHDTEQKETPSIHVVEAPLNLISDESSKRIPIIDFYVLAKELSIDMDLVKTVNFNDSDYAIFSEMISLLDLVIGVSQYSEEKTKFYQIMFDFMVEHGYHVIKVPQPTRNMVKVFYIMVDINMFNNGKVYTLDEFK